jgi:prepilin signal peptidase PulO-like enzyme (type II secretory pathway)
MDTSTGPDPHTGAGLAGGTVLVLLNVTTLQLVETMLLAVLGAAVSFTTSMALKWLLREIRGKRRTTDNTD